MVNRATHGLISVIVGLSLQGGSSAVAPAGHLVRHHAFPVPSCEAASYGSTHHDYPATDIFVVRGTRFLAATTGVVERVSRVDRWDPGLDRPWTRGGRFVSLVGDDGVRYYGSHLRSVASGIGPGDRVRVGQLLGFTGQSGNARLSVPHLHFGISHPTTASDWGTRRGEVWPYRYLRAWCAGRDPTPDLPSRVAPRKHPQPSAMLPTRR